MRSGISLRAWWSENGWLRISREPGSSASFLPESFDGGLFLGIFQRAIFREGFMGLGEATGPTEHGRRRCSESCATWEGRGCRRERLETHT